MNLKRINVVLAIILLPLLLGVGAVVIQKVRAAESRAQTRSNLSAVCAALERYQDQTRRYPPAFDRTDTMPTPVSLHVHLLPFLDQQEVYKSFVAGTGNGDVVVPQYVATFDRSVEDGAGVQCFAANLRLFSRKGSEASAAQDLPPLGPVEAGGSYRQPTIPRGASNTLALATKLARAGEGGSRYAADPTSPFAPFFGQNVAHTTAHYSNPRATFQWAPRGEECLTSPLMAQTYTPEPILAAMADGSVRPISGAIAPEIWNMILHPSGR